MMSFYTKTGLKHVKKYMNLRLTSSKPYFVVCNPILSRNSVVCNGIRLRFLSQTSNKLNNNNKTVDLNKKSILYYFSGLAILVAGLSYAAVPLYRIFCQATGYGGETTKGHDTSKVESMKAIANRKIKIRFNADTASTMTWKFMPQQREILVSPGETALAFYTATNPMDKPIIGIATYNVVPFEAGQYFNKIQCFCFEEQRLNAREQVDMPVFFYIDPEFADDPKLEHVDTLILSYTFFEAKEGISLPIPSYASRRKQHLREIESVLETRAVTE